VRVTLGSFSCVVFVLSRFVIGDYSVMRVALGVRDYDLRLVFSAFERVLGSNKCTWQMAAAAKEWQASERSVKDWGHESIEFRIGSLNNKHVIA
jgi:hypothetical protein